MIHLNIHNETSELKSVLLGISTNFGGVPEIEECYDPKSREHILSNTFPVQSNISLEINDFKPALFSINILCFNEMSFFTVSGVTATRDSNLSCSFGMPIFIFSL